MSKTNHWNIWTVFSVIKFIVPVPAINLDSVFNPKSSNEFENRFHLFNGKLTRSHQTHPKAIIVIAFAVGSNSSGISSLFNLTCATNYVVIADLVETATPVPAINVFCTKTVKTRIFLFRIRSYRTVKDYNSWLIHIRTSSTRVLVRCIFHRSS